ncbi:MAG: hypothetical protein H3C48_02545 [Chitinophagaceae bacterium]|nr:hypothetical protein [Chitinophagaceae bacterium]
MEFKAHGKLLLFGEYIVLEGSKCLAIPLHYHQTLTVKKSDSLHHIWRSLESGKEWFSCSFNDKLDILQSNHAEAADTLRQLLMLIYNKLPTLFQEKRYFEVNADFPLKWGLGSSSTLVSLLSQWSGLDPYALLDNSFGGSGYDIACATASGPILYEKSNRKTQSVMLPDSISSRLLFIYSGRKQLTTQETLRFKGRDIPKNAVDRMNQMIDGVLQTKQIADFEKYINESESLLASLLQKEAIQEVLFKDYPYSIKSLGAWGGDFFMASYRDEKEARDYFSQKGYPVHFTYPEIIYHP